MNTYEKILVETKTEFSDFCILKKNESSLMKFIDVALKIITMGQMRIFMTGFITTLGQVVYVPEDWDIMTMSNKSVIIRHERVHMRQARKYSRFLFSVLYLFVPLPGGLSYFRKKFEQEAYEESLKAHYEYHGEKAFTPQLKENIISHFMSSQYFWMWPFRKNLECWYDKFVVKLLTKEYLK